MGKRLPEPLAVVRFNHATLELWPEHCRTVFPDGKEVTAAPNEGETLVECVLHEAVHHLHAQVTANAPSACLRAVANGDGKRWTPERRAEEEFAYPAGKILADLFRQMRKAYG